MFFWRSWRFKNTPLNTPRHQSPANCNAIMTPPEPSDADLELALEQQQDLVESSLELVFQTYDEADTQGPVVVMLVDCEDEVGSQVARAWLGDEAVDDAIAQRHVDDQANGQASEEGTTAFAATVGWDSCQQEIGQLFPYLMEAFDEDAPTDGIMVVSVTAGGASALVAPLDARP